MNCSVEENIQKKDLQNNFKESLFKHSKPSNNIDISMVGKYHNKLLEMFKQHGEWSPSKMEYYNEDGETLLKFKNKVSYEELESLMKSIKDKTFLDKYEISEKLKYEYQGFTKGLFEKSTLDEVKSYCSEFIKKIPELKLSEIESSSLKGAAYIAKSSSEFWYNEALNPKNTFYKSAINKDPKQEPFIGLISPISVAGDIAAGLIILVATEGLGAHMAVYGGAIVSAGIESLE